LSDLLSERIVLNGSGPPNGLIRASEVPGLFVLTSGSGSTPPANLLYGSRMPDLLRRLRLEFDTILIDTPPMLQLPDARALGKMAGGVILVVRCGKTSRDSALAARRRMTEDGANILGTILNDWNPRDAPNRLQVYYKESFKHFRKHYAANGG
jgi:succinoglycan biosynthesis transport protein ExoP